MSKSNILSILVLLCMLPGLTLARGNAAEGKIKSTTCQACHGPAGKSVQPIYPDLAGQHEDYLVYSLKAFRDGTRQNAIMSGFAATLSDQDIEDLAAWYASQSGLTEIRDK